MNKIGKRWTGVLALFLVVLVILVVACRGELVQERSSYNVPIYTEQGGAKMVFETGSELEVQSGATLDIQSGSTVGFEDVTINDDLTVGGDADVTGNLTAGNVTSITDDLTLTDDLFVGDDAQITDTLDLDGNLDLDGDGFDVNITAGFSIDADAASNINVAGAGVDLTLESEAGSIVIKGDEALATGITLDANDNAATGITALVGATNGFIVSGGKLDIQTGPLTLENDESIVNANGSFDFTRNDAGVVTLTCSDDDAIAGCVYDAGGASPIVVGSGDVTNVTVTTDGSGDAELSLPENSIGPDELAVMVDQVILCGDNVSATTTYAGPAVALLAGDYTTSYALAGAGCDALDNTTEGTADAPIGFANTAFKVLGMVCEVDSSGSNGVVFTLRSAAANLTPSVTCTIPTGETTCSTVTASTTDIAAGATLAVQVVTTEDLSSNDFWCKAFIAYK